jgi:HPt (histidine-containing phosphotransfer) domain-containing protein
MGAMTTMDRQSFQNSGNSDNNLPAISASEFDALVEMVGPDMPEVLLDLLDTYLEESAGLVDAIHTGLRQSDLSSMLRPAHSLKSSSASIGAMRLSKLCSDLETHLRGSMPGLDVPKQVQLVENEFARVQSALVIEKEKLRA